MVREGGVMVSGYVRAVGGRKGDKAVGEYRVSNQLVT